MNVPESGTVFGLAVRGEFWSVGGVAQSPESNPPAGELSVGLFPLPEVALFPGALLPLLVFEPRYRALVADVLEGDRLIAVPRLLPGHEEQYEGAPPVTSTFGLGSVIQDVRLPDGRYRIVLQGHHRVRLLAEETVARPYRVARVRVLDDRNDADDATLLGLRTSLVGLVERVARLVASPAEELIDAVRRAPTAGRCADLVAATLAREPNLQQELIEELSVARRLEHLIAHLQETLAELDPADGALVN